MTARAVRIDGPILPTHRCFDDAIAFCEQRAREGHPSVDTTLRVVHGIILGPDDGAAHEVEPGTPSVHAWVEDGAIVWDAGLLTDGRTVVFSVERAEYYAHYRVQATTVYTMRELLEENRRSGHFGPWRPEYRALCRNKENPR